MRDGDIDLAAVLLRHFLEGPLVETVAALKNDDLGPAVREHFVSLGGNGGVLQRPERVGAGEVAVLAEEVGLDAALVALKREQGGCGRNRLPAAEPLLDAIAMRSVVVVLKEFQPFALLLDCRHGEKLQRVETDLLLPVEIADSEKQIAEREALLDLAWREAEGHCDFLDFLSFADEFGERLELRNLVRVTPRDILDQRSLDRVGVVALGHQGAGNWVERTALLFDGLGREVTPPAGDDFEPFGVRSNEDRLKDSAFADTRQKVGNVRFLLLEPHVEG